jgi:quinol monooxygenase YgiN
MAIRHVVTIQVAPGRADDFARALKALQAIALQEEGCEQYELFHSVDEAEKVLLLERWTSHELLDKHMEAERTPDRSAIDALVALWGAWQHANYRALRTVTTHFRNHDMGAIRAALSCVRQTSASGDISSPGSVGTSIASALPAHASMSSNARALSCG